jgi:hypothetical protein
MSDKSGNQINKSAEMSLIHNSMVSGGSAPQSPASPRTMREADADINIKPSKYPMSP